MAYLKNVQSDGAPLSYFTYGRLSGGNIDRILREAGFTIYYSYDLADRLIKEVWRNADQSQIYCFAYDYDAAGNRVDEDKNGQAVYYVYDAANELMLRNAPSGGTAAWTYFAYDENGSQIREYDQTAGSAMYYDYADNGLVSRIRPPADNPSYFNYDARMQRFAIDFAGTLSYFGWDGLNQLTEKDSTLSTTAKHTHGSTPIDGIASVVMTKRGTDRQYLHYDHRGSLIKLQKDSLIDLEEEYNAFGVNLLHAGSSYTRFGYQGTSWIRNNIGNNIIYLSPIRYYTPITGRFGQRDLYVIGSTGILGYANNISMYSNYIYSKNAPTKYVDPIGYDDFNCDIIKVDQDLYRYPLGRISDADATVDTRINPTTILRTYIVGKTQDDIWLKLCCCKCTHNLQRPVLVQYEGFVQTFIVAPWSDIWKVNNLKDDYITTLVHESKHAKSTEDFFDEERGRLMEYAGSQSQCTTNAICVDTILSLANKFLERYLAWWILDTANLDKPTRSGMNFLIRKRREWLKKKGVILEGDCVIVPKAT